MKLVIFGLSVSSSWGNGHATLWRGLCRALADRGHQIVFFERDVPYYASHRDLVDLPNGRLQFYSEWDEVLATANDELSRADVAIVTSYCPDGIAATDLVASSSVPIRAFYDLDTPVTLDRLRTGEPVSYIGERGLIDFDVVLSYTGGRAIDQLQTQLGARQVRPLYGSVDPLIHHPAPSRPEYAADLSYLGTYAEDRQRTLNELFVEPARRMPDRRFCMGGSLYGRDFPWTDNIFFRHHVAPAEHSAFYCSSRLTLNVTRRAMREMGYCPSGRLFEAAACGVPVISDDWEGIESFFEPGKEIIIASEADDVVRALRMSEAELRRIAGAARERTLAEHTADKRALELEQIFSQSHRLVAVGTEA